MTDTGEEPPEPEEEEQEEDKENAEKNEKKAVEKPDEKKDEEEEEEEEKEPLDLTLELVDANGNSSRLPLSYFSTLHPPLKVTYTKWPMFENFAYEKSTEPLLETFEFPLKAFTQTNPDFEPGKLEKIIFLFDKGSEGVIYLDEIGFREEIQSLPDCLVPFYYTGLSWSLSFIGTFIIFTDLWHFLGKMPIGAPCSHQTTGDKLAVSNHFSSSLQAIPIHISFSFIGNGDIF